MSRKYLHTCERCGQQAHLERVGRFRDQDYYDLWHELAELEQELKRAKAAAACWRAAYRISAFPPRLPTEKEEVLEANPFAF